MEPADVSPQQAIEFLHKLVTEQIEVRAVLTSPRLGLHGSLRGTVKVGPNDNFWIVESSESNSSVLAFDPSIPATRRYGDYTVANGYPIEYAFKQRFTSGMTFTFPDGSTFALFELAHSDKQ